jgi:hypothetical protein
MLCESCRVTKATTIQLGELKCLPWHCNYDLDMVSPVYEEGYPVLPGIRVCGHKDCVNKDHIIKAHSDLELERNDISYRTGRLDELQDYMRELSA